LPINMILKNKSNNMQSFFRQNGYIALISVLIIGAMALSVGLSLLTIGISNTQTALVRQQLEQSKALSSACAEKALYQIRADNNYSGTLNFNLGQGTCSVMVIKGGSENRTVQSTGTVNNTNARIKIILSDIYPTLVISSWQEVDSF